MKEVYTDRDVVATLLSKETEISNKFHNAVSEVLRLGYNTERGKKIIPELISSVQYSFEDIDRVSSKYNK